MTILQNYYHQTIKKELILKYSYKKINDIPKITKIVLNFGCKTSDFFEISSALLFLELIVKKKSSLTDAKTPNLLLQIRKGNVVGCSVVLTDIYVYDFLFQLLTVVFPNMKNFDGIKVSKKKLLSKSFSFSFIDFIGFKDLEKQLYLFPKLPPLNVTILTSTQTSSELMYLLQSFKLPLYHKKN